MKNINIENTIIYEDKDLLVCHKPSGLPVQSKKIGSMDMESALLNYLAGKGEEPYLAVIHRLDQPVEGILVFAKNREAAKKLNAQLQNRKMEKYYLAVVCGKPESSEGRLEDELIRDGKSNSSRVVKKKTADSKKAVLDYKIVKEQEDLTLLEISLLTGRHHQIRVQLSHAGWPLFGDTKYNPQAAKEEKWQQIALCAYKLIFMHPLNGKKMVFEVNPSGNFPIV